MRSEQSQNPQVAESHDGRLSGDMANWSGSDARARKKKNPGQKGKSGDAASLPAFTPTAGDQQQRMIAEAAYYRAEKRGFTEGYSLDD